MRLKELTVENWRSFYGMHQINFSTDASRPVSVIFAPNGSGKTSLLNAFTWCIYNKFTRGFRMADDLVNHLAQRHHATTATARVTVVFEHENAIWTVQRSTMPTLAAETDLVVERKELDGVDAGKTRRKEIEDVYKILPPQLSEYFFMPGEALSTVSFVAARGDRDHEGGSAENVALAIRSLLDFDVYQNAIDDIGKALGLESLRPPQTFRDETIERAEQNVMQCRADIDTARVRQRELPGLILTAEEVLANRESAARGVDEEAINRWRHRYDELVSQVETATQSLHHAQALLTTVLRQSFRLYADVAAREAIDALNTAEQDGVIPPHVSSELLGRMLDEPSLGCVICRQELGPHQLSLVQQLRERVTASSLATDALEVRTLLYKFVDASSQHLGHVRSELAQLGETASETSTWRDVIEAADRAVDECMGRLQTSRTQLEEFREQNTEDRNRESKALLNGYVLAQRSLDELLNEQAGLDEWMHDLENKYKDAELDYQRKLGKVEHYVHLTAAREILGTAEQFFEDAQKGITEYGRADFERAINRLYSRLVAKEFIVRVRGDFTLEVSLDGTPISLSQSETVLLTIAFLEAIAALAPEYRRLVNDSGGALFEQLGQIEAKYEDAFPVVLDAPFSSLEKEYASRLAAALPETLPQTIVFTTMSALPYLSEVHHKIGAAAILQRIATPNDNAVSSQIHWRGRDYDYVSINDSAESGSTIIRALT